MSNETLSTQPQTTGYEDLKKVEFSGDKRSEVLKDLQSKNPNYSKVIKTLKELNSPKITTEALASKETGAPLLFLLAAEKYMPLHPDEDHAPLDIEDTELQEYLAQKTMEDRPDSVNTIEDYKKAIKNAQNLWLSSYKVISREDRESWRQTLCVNALDESAGADTNEALKIILALNKGIDVTKPEFFKIDHTPGEESITLYGEKGRFNYMVNDEKVRALVLRYGGKKGLEFYRKIIGDHPSESEQKIFATELARRRTGAKSYGEIPKETYKQIEKIVMDNYKEESAA